MLGHHTAGRLAKTGVKTGFVEAGCHRRRQWEKAVAATIATLGGFDILVNNAGIEISSLVVDLEPSDLRRMCEVNILGTALGIKHALRACVLVACRHRRLHHQHLLGGRNHRVPGIAGYSAHQVGCRSLHADCRGRVGQARLRRPRQLHLSRACSHRHGHATRQRHGAAGPLAQRRSRRRRRHRAHPARPAR